MGCDQPGNLVTRWRENMTRMRTSKAQQPIEELRGVFRTRTGYRSCDVTRPARRREPAVARKRDFDAMRTQVSHCGKGSIPFRICDKDFRRDVPPGWTFCRTHIAADGR